MLGDRKVGLSDNSGELDSEPARSGWRQGSGRISLSDNSGELGSEPARSFWRQGSVIRWLVHALHTTN